MEMSSKVRYGFLALIKLASHYKQGAFLQIDQLATEQKIPDRYLAQLLIALKRCGLVRSQRGAKGGYLLAREPRQIRLLEVIACLEGTKKVQPESQTEFSTIENFVLEEVWQEANTAAIAVLQGYTLQDLCEKRDESRSNTMYYI